MHPDHPSFADPRPPGEGLRQLWAGAQLAGLLGVWLAVLPIIPLYAGGAWAGQTIKRRLVRPA